MEVVNAEHLGFFRVVMIKWTFWKTYKSIPTDLLFRGEFHLLQGFHGAQSLNTIFSWIALRKKQTNQPKTALPVNSLGERKAVEIFFKMLLGIVNN